MISANMLNFDPGDVDKPVYRIMSEYRVIQMFKERRNVLVQSKLWKDKFENFQLTLGGCFQGSEFQYGFKDDFVGQCWTSEYLSEAMWGIYANDKDERFLRIKSTPRKLFEALCAAHPDMPQETCFIGRVQYQKEEELQAFLQNGGKLEISSERFARSFLLKRKQFRHENEVRLIYFGNANHYENNIYRYPIDPHDLILQIMGDPNRERAKWREDQKMIAEETGFKGDIKRSKIYDAPAWNTPEYY